VRGLSSGLDNGLLRFRHEDWSRHRVLKHVAVRHLDAGSAIARALLVRHRCSTIVAFVAADFDEQIAVADIVANAGDGALSPFMLPARRASVHCRYRRCTDGGRCPGCRRHHRFVPSRERGRDLWCPFDPAACRLAQKELRLAACRKAPCSTAWRQLETVSSFRALGSTSRGRQAKGLSSPGVKQVPSTARPSWVKLHTSPAALSSQAAKASGGGRRPSGCSRRRTWGAFDGYNDAWSSTPRQARTGS
jgi:hypothetical protein